MRLAALRQRNWLILHDVDSLCDAPGTHQIDPDLFTRDYWRERGLIVGEAPGRGSSLFLQATPTEQWVLRPYRRGGMAAKLSEKRYLWTGAERTRAFRELRLTATLFEQGLPVPRPVASGVTRYGLTYEAALITVRIAGAKAFAELLVNNLADEALLKRVGAMIYRFHQAGLDHVDLNARNILIDPSGAPWLIDLDRCRLRAAGKWQEKNLARLERSLRKFSAISHSSELMGSIRQGYCS
ncbi:MULTISPECIES: 3-deoxy-D-manno-octulosonic acid kinase [unclassified Halomonas]|uniref:3-deoxy-D-manno-octulosonic acid kinase n=1 Tax=unclassified Halomonas TaxID=2609666 RepID=UPI000489DC75|nr:MULTISPECIES: 3-deoxy-D-manno-octulosonic acid kinase [unclassified Halomonas]PKH58378.1 3-deoxy-D-manno-octulosonic acid kinase [Halomonas sp. Choline-3u-9]QGQ68970.1 3-deoxy-D-manno-octulosonic acid kinase [Halomonas sp. PA16-9]